MNNKVMEENRYALTMQLFFYHALYEWKYKPNTRLSHYLSDKLKQHYKSQNANLLKEMKRYTARSLVTQYFVYLYELLDGNFDESLKKNKNDFSKIKFNIDTNGSLKCINARQLLNIIRQSFAHNDDGNMVPNWMWDKYDNIIIHKKLKNNEVELKIHINELISLANIYLINGLEAPRSAVSMYASRLSNAVLENKLNPFNVHKYVGAFDPITKTDIPLDKLQKRALYNFFIKSSEGLDRQMIQMGIHPYDPSLLVLKYPFKCNSNNAIKDIQKIIEFLTILNDTNLTRNEFMRKVFNKKIEKGEAVDIIEIQDYLGPLGRFEACIANNILFTIFTYMEPSKIKQYLNKNNDIDLNKIRNSIMHGRFYYNYEDGFHFYDGIIDKKNDGKSIKEIEKDIQYVGTLTLSEIDSLTMNLIHDYISTVIFDDKKKI